MQLLHENCHFVLTGTVVLPENRAVDIYVVSPIVGASMHLTMTDKVTRTPVLRRGPEIHVSGFRERVPTGKVPVKVDEMGIIGRISLGVTDAVRVMARKARKVLVSHMSVMFEGIITIKAVPVVMALEA